MSDRLGDLQVTLSDHDAHPMGCDCDLCFLYVFAVLVEQAYPLIFQEYNGVDPKNWIERTIKALKGFGITPDEWSDGKTDIRDRLRRGKDSG